LNVSNPAHFGSTVSVSSFLNVSNPAHFGSTVSVSSFLNVQSTITAGVDVHAKGNVLADAVVAGGTVTFVLRGPGGAAINYSTTTGTWGADLYFDPRIANTVVVGVSAHTAAFSTPTTVNLYCGTSYATSSFVAPIAGANYTLIYNSGPQTGTPNTQFNFGYGIQGGAPQHVGSGLTMISFASDGNNLFQTAVWPPQAL
jgi:hypothetical protein